MNEIQQNHFECVSGSDQSSVVKGDWLSTCCLVLMTLVLPACGEAPPSGVGEAPPSDVDVAASAVLADIDDAASVVLAVIAGDETGGLGGGVIEFSLAGEKLEFPSLPCRITTSMVIIHGKNGETAVSLRYDGRPKVDYQHYFERDGVRYWDQWDSKRADIEYFVDGGTVTASGTMRNTINYREGSNGGWENASESYGYEAPDEQAFTFSVTCY
jgi:hypothetical protein